MFFHARVDLGKGADGARDGAGGDFLAGGDQAVAGAGKFRVGIGQLEPERHRLGMDAMGAADGRGHLVLEGTLLERRQNLVDVRNQQVRGAGELDVETGVEHVGGGHALMDEAGLGADDFGQMGEEGDDVVLGLALNLVDPGDVEGGIFGLGPDRLRGFVRDCADFRQRVSRMRLDLEPDLEAGLRLPDGGHFRAGIAGNHRRAPGELFFTPRFSRAAEARQTATPDAERPSCGRRVSM